MRFSVILTLLACGLIGCGGANDLRDVQRQVRERYKDVRQIQSSELIAERDRGEPLVLVDVRSAEEFAVSRIQNARRIEPGSSAAALRDAAQGMSIVVYCSVGHRSCAFAEELSAAGFTNVRNLDGGIFRWAIEGNPLVNDDGVATRVHGYNQRWEKLLPEKLRGK